MQEELMHVLLGTMSVGVLHCCTGCARGLHGGNSDLVMFCAEHVSCSFGSYWNMCRWELARLTCPEMLKDFLV